MRLVPFMWVIWSVLAAITAALYIYRSNLTKDEEDQIFLDDAGQHQQKEQTEIVAKCQRIQPFVRIATGATCVLSACILGVYVWDAVRHLM